MSGFSRGFIRNWERNVPETALLLGCFRTDGSSRNAMSTSSNTTPCRFWLQGTCKKGKHCPFKHERSGKPGGKPGGESAAPRHPTEGRRGSTEKSGPFSVVFDQTPPQSMAMESNWQKIRGISGEMAISDAFSSHPMDSSSLAVQQITVYANVSLRADKMYAVVLHTRALQTMMLGHIHCAAKVLTAPTPEQVKSLHAQTPLAVYVYEIEPPLAWKTAGTQFESFAEDLIASWRHHVMSAAAQRIETGALPQHEAVKASDMFQVLTQLHTHVKSDAVDAEFSSAALRLTDS